MAKDITPKVFDAEIGKLKIESDDRVESGTSITSLSHSPVLSKINVYEFIAALADKADLSVTTDETNGTLTISRPENLIVQTRRQELANQYGNRPYSQLDQVSQALINHILEEEVASGKHKQGPNRPK